MSLTKEDKDYIRQEIVAGITEAIQSLIMPRFDEINDRFERIEARLDAIEIRLDRVELRLNKLEKRFDHLAMI